MRRGGGDTWRARGRCRSRTCRYTALKSKKITADESNIEAAKAVTSGSMRGCFWPSERQLMKIPARARAGFGRWWRRRGDGGGADCTWAGDAEGDEAEVPQWVGAEVDVEA